jgi:hypothetical protein
MSMKFEKLLRTTAPEISFTVGWDALTKAYTIRMDTYRRGNLHQLGFVSGSTLDGAAERASELLLRERKVSP